MNALKQELHRVGLLKDSIDVKIPLSLMKNDAEGLLGAIKNIRDDLKIGNKQYSIASCNQAISFAEGIIRQAKKSYLE